MAKSNKPSLKVQYQRIAVGTITFAIGSLLLWLLHFTAVKFLVADASIFIGIGILNYLIFEEKLAELFRSTGIVFKAICFSTYEAVMIPILVSAGIISGLLALFLSIISGFDSVTVADNIGDRYLDFVKNAQINGNSLITGLIFAMLFFVFGGFINLMQSDINASHISWSLFLLMVYGIFIIFSGFDQVCQEQGWWGKHKR